MLLAPGGHTRGHGYSSCGLYRAGKCGQGVNVDHSPGSSDSWSENKPQISCLNMGKRVFPSHQFHAGDFKEF